MRGSGSWVAGRWNARGANWPSAHPRARIQFFGEIPDRELPAYYSSADLVVLPSNNRSEAFGQVLLEAMAAGRPVVSTELGTGTSVVNRHEETGLVVAPNDSHSLATALEALVTDPARRAWMGANGRRRMLARFHVNQMADRTVDIYREALGDHRPGLFAS